MGGPETGARIEQEEDDQGTEPVAISNATNLAATTTVAKSQDKRPLMRELSLPPSYFMPGRKPDKDKRPAKVSSAIVDRMRRVINSGGGHGGSGK